LTRLARRRRPQLFPHEADGRVLVSLMVDKAAIFMELTIRNAVRRDAKLPLLDLRTEFEYAVSLAVWKEGRERFDCEIPRIKQEVVAELQRTRGPEFDEYRSAGARWLISYKVAERYYALLADHGYLRPTPPHQMVYGMDRAEAVDGT
jgi:hypothetical protein